MEKESKTRALKKYLFVTFIFIAIIISIFLMVRYGVEGEKNLPIELKEITIISSIYAQSNNEENKLESTVEQENDIYISFKDNPKLDSKVELIRIENLRIKKSSEIGSIKILKPTSNEKLKYFQNSTQDYSGQTLEYSANTSDNMEKQQFYQDGGTIAFRISNQGLGNYVLTEGEQVSYNGKLLEKLGASSDDIKLNATMDIVLIVDKNEKYKGTISIELPAGEFNENGIVTKQITDFKNVIFKRVTE
jgi:hypothetical protein